MTGTLSAAGTAGGLELGATTASEIFSALWVAAVCDVLLLPLLILGDLDRVLFLEEDLRLDLDPDLDRDSDRDLDRVYERRLERETLLEREYDLPLEGDGVEV